MKRYFPDWCLEQREKLKTCNRGLCPTLVFKCFKISTSLLSSLCIFHPASPPFTIPGHSVTKGSFFPPSHPAIRVPVSPALLGRNQDTGRLQARRSAGPIYRSDLASVLAVPGVAPTVPWVCSSWWSDQPCCKGRLSFLFWPGSDGHLQHPPSSSSLKEEGHQKSKDLLCLSPASWDISAPKSLSSQSRRYQNCSIFKREKLIQNYANPRLVAAPLGCLYH